MIKKLNLLLFSLLTVNLAFSQTPNYPLFKGCQEHFASDSAMAEECSREAFDIILKDMYQKMVGHKGSYFNDEITAELQIDTDGGIKIRSLHSRYLKETERLAKNYLENLEGKLQARSKKEKLILKIVFDLPSEDEVDIIETEESIPTVLNCASFNKAGQFSCLAALVMRELKTFSLRKYDAYTRTEVVFDHEGRFLGIRFLSPVLPTQRHINDSLLNRLSRLSRYTNLAHHGFPQGKGFKLKYTYHLFESVVDMRRNFDLLAPEYLAQGDTALFLTDLALTAATYNRYSNFHSYFEDKLNFYKLNRKGHLDIRDNSISIDSLLSHKYYFDQSTSDLLAGDLILPICGRCTTKPDSLGNDTLYSCLKDYLKEALYTGMKENYDVDLSDLAFSVQKYTWKHNLYDRDTVDIEKGFVVFEIIIDREGYINYARILNQSNNLTLIKYMDALDNGASRQELDEIVASDIYYYFIDVLTKLPPIKPARFNKTDTYYRTTVFIPLGVKS